MNLLKECSKLLFGTEHTAHTPGLFQGWPSLLGDVPSLWVGGWGRVWRGDTGNKDDLGMGGRGLLRLAKQRQRSKRLFGEKVLMADRVVSQGKAGDKEAEHSGTGTWGWEEPKLNRTADLWVLFF